jgi:hypothetical protein
MQNTPATKGTIRFGSDAADMIKPYDAGVISTFGSAMKKHSKVESDEIATRAPKGSKHSFVYTQQLSN